LTEGKDLRLNNLPTSAWDGYHLQVLPPGVEEFKQAYESLMQDYEEIIVILLSGHLIPAVNLATQAATASGSSLHIQIVDSQTTAIGLGLLVQTAAGAAHLGAPISEILHVVRASIAHIYAIFCLYSLTYLYNSAQIDPAQAWVGEMLNLAPLFFLEEGRLVPIQKVRNSRHLVDTLHEFITEFNHVRHLALIQGLPSFTNEAHNLHERILQDNPTIPYSEHHLSVSLACILGPHSLGLVVMEDF
jgi:DegV family protein with EDD domain